MRSLSPRRREWVLRRLACALGLSSLAFTVPALAAEPSKADAEPSKADTETQLPIEAGRHAWQATGRTPQLLWTGFRAAPTGGEVLLQLTAPVPIETRTTGAGQIVVFKLKGCRAARRNDRLPLETRYFGTAVRRVSVRQRGANLEVAVVVRGWVAPSTRQQSGPSGSAFWVLAFPSAPRGRAVAAR